jgi:threonine/homoserine/homoserine lactone efflux protein
VSWNDRAPQDRATAQILIVFGGIVTALGVGLFWVAVTTHALDDTSRRGLPMWLLAPLGALGGAWLIWRGIVMYRADKTPRR